MDCDDATNLAPVFLGICDKADYIAETGKWNLLGLGNAIFPFIFPFDLQNLILGFSFSNLSLSQDFQIKIKNQNNMEIGTLKMSAQLAGDLSVEEVVLKQKSTQIVRAMSTERVNFFISCPPGIVICMPGKYGIWIEDSKSTKIGSFDCIPIKCQILTKDKEAAIRSDPNAAKAVRTEIGCNKCVSKYRSYAALDRHEKLENEGWKWYLEVDDEFICECGSTRVDLSHIRNNLHSFLGRNTLGAPEINLVPLYQAEALKKIRKNFYQLLEIEPKEEIVQKFISENPILLHQFSADRIILKPPILSKFNADFGILTARRELIFVEIEKPAIRLLKKDGHRASPLIHAFDQVRDWLQEVVEHRTSILHNLDIKTEDVSSIHGVVIAGRDKGYDAGQMRSLKMSTDSDIRFFTYDDFLSALDVLIEKFERL